MLSAILPLQLQNFVTYGRDRPPTCLKIYGQASNIRSTLGNKLIAHSDVVGASPVGAAPTTSSFLT